MKEEDNNAALYVAVIALILALLSLFGCVEKEIQPAQKTVMEVTYLGKDTLVLFYSIDSTLYNKEPWWPGFRDMVLPMFGPNLTVIRVDSTENRYSVYYVDGSTWGQYQSVK